MNLRHQFIILILTVVLMPVFMMGISFSLFNKVMYSSDPRIISEEFFTRARDAESPAQVDELFDTLEDSYVGIMVKASDIFFSDPETDYNRLDPVMIVASRQQTFSDGSSVYIILGVKIFEKSTTVFTVIFILSIMLPLILIPLMIIRSINSSINKLEAATGRIADGELDFELKMKRRDKLGSLAVSLDTMRRQIKSEQDRRNRFYMGVSHDLMTPLAHIGGYSDALLEGLSQNEEMTHKYLKIINNKSHQMEQRITQLLDYLNCSNADFRQDLEENSIGEFLTEYLQLHQEEQGFYNRNLNWEVNISQNCLIPFHEELVTRALDNLIQNGFKYGTEGSSMEVEAREEDARIIIDVVNHGAAIPQESLETIFEPFFRGDKTRRGDGFGLGLSSVKSIAESHGWFITVKSDEEETRFSILIPKAVKK